MNKLMADSHDEDAVLWDKYLYGSQERDLGEAEDAAYEQTQQETLEEEMNCE